VYNSNSTAILVRAMQTSTVTAKPSRSSSGTLSSVGCSDSGCISIAVPHVVQRARVHSSRYRCRGQITRIKGGSISLVIHFCLCGDELQYRICIFNVRGGRRSVRFKKEWLLLGRPGGASAACWCRRLQGSWKLCPVIIGRCCFFRCRTCGPHALASPSGACWPRGGVVVVVECKLELIKAESPGNSRGVSILFRCFLEASSTSSVRCIGPAKLGRLCVSNVLVKLDKHLRRQRISQRYALSRIPRYQIINVSM